MTSAPVFPLPVSLSPSRISSFTSCPLAFRFVNVEGLPDPPTIYTTKGTIVHRVLELLFALPADQRTPQAAEEAHATARDEFTNHSDVTSLQLSPKELEALWKDTQFLVQNYFTMEDPRLIQPEGLELRLEAQMGEFTLRGIIDRLERTPEGQLIVSDYKTGRSPHESQAQARMNQMMLYAWLCQQQLGQLPSTLRLLYVRDGHTLEASPTEQSMKFLVTRTTAVFNAITNACNTGNFKPNKSALCKSCRFQKWCPEFGGDPSRAATEAPAQLAPPQ